MPSVKSYGIHIQSQDDDKKNAQYITHEMHLNRKHW